jgi:hypothetical protein
LIKDRLRELFNAYDPGLQKIIHEVLLFEQENISKDQPHFKEPIDVIISREAKQQAQQEKKEAEE